MQRRLTCCAGRDCAVHGFRVARPLYWSDEGCCASAGCPCSRSFRRCTSRQSQVSACPLAALPNGLPPETVFLAVVDPGVGAGTRPRRTKARALMTRTNTSNIVQIDRLARFWRGVQWARRLQLEGRHNYRRKRSYSPIVRTTLLSGRVLLEDSLSSCASISSYFGTVATSPFGTTCTTL
jgi:hypothetical protein